MPDQIVFTKDAPSGPIMTKLKWVFGIFVTLVLLAILGLAAYGGYTLQQNASDLQRLHEQNEKIIAENKKLMDSANTLIAKVDDRDKVIAERDKRIEGLQKQIIALGTERNKILKDYEKKILDVSKPLPEPEQDQFFLGRGYVGSKYQKDGGRLFSNPDTINLQVNLVKGERDGELLVNCEKRAFNYELAMNEYANNVIDLKKNESDMRDAFGKCSEAVSGLTRELDKKDKEIILTKEQARKQKLKKWLTVIGVGLVAGGVGYTAGGH